MGDASSVKSELIFDKRPTDFTLKKDERST